MPKIFFNGVDLGRAEAVVIKAGDRMKRLGVSTQEAWAAMKTFFAAATITNFDGVWWFGRKFKPRKPLTRKQRLKKLRRERRRRRPLYLCEGELKSPAYMKLRELIERGQVLGVGGCRHLEMYSRFK